MTEEKPWTAGPWSAERDLPHNRMPRVHGGDHSLICEVGNMGTDQDQWEANARLIAASPRLYEALEKALNFIQNTESELGIELECGELARAALAQARGE